MIIIYYLRVKREENKVIILIDISNIYVMRREKERKIYSDEEKERGKIKSTV